ncbi:RraA family protein [Psychrosphaera ytuae]|uniref:Putative 4-hydroxy-4-methyl-2-oxoglutarate aldolase n=1 Tax=Psychrosphaera ytuae TaxID=2820710 RepID=A0A975DCN6_9GAMM|nr:RraA family protein [Psychrosphaera ytuae]QTH63911.1 RraA family protein [Psychrosphaera ytuae]
MNALNDIPFDSLSPTDYANVMPRCQFIDHSIQPLLSPTPRVSGPAFTVQLTPGDHLMMHVAIYQAPPGSIIVVDGVNCDFAVAGGNVCAVAQQRGIKGFVVNGVIRDVEEVREMGFAVFAKGVFPVPGGKNHLLPLNQPIQCGGVKVAPGDIIVADVEGIAVLPSAQAEQIFDKANQKAQKEQQMTLEQWRANHEQRIAEAVAKAQKNVAQ